MSHLKKSLGINSSSYRVTANNHGKENSKEGDGITTLGQDIIKLGNDD